MGFYMATGSAVKAGKSKSKRERQKLLQFFLYISPWLVGLTLFSLIPIVMSFVLSFTKYDLLSAPEFIGLKNYINLFTNTPEFSKGLVNTFYYTFFRMLFVIIISLFFAVLLDQKLKGVRVFRTLYYLPSVLPFISGTLLWMYMFNFDFGLLNSAFGVFGIKPIDWFGVKNAMNSIILMSVWGGIGPTLTILLAGMQSVPTTLYESMDLDGAGSFKKFLYVTLPMISPSIFYVAIMGVIGCLQEFASIMLLTEGGPENATTTLTYQVYQYAFTSRTMGFASAYSWVVFVIILVFTAIFFKWGNKAVYYEGGDK